MNTELLFENRALYGCETKEGIFYPADTAELLGRLQENRSILSKLEGRMGLTTGWVETLPEKTNLVGLATQPFYIFGGLFHNPEEVTEAIGAAIHIAESMKATGTNAEAVPYTYPGNDGAKKDATPGGMGDFFVVDNNDGTSKERIWVLGARKENQDKPYDSLPVDGKAKAASLRDILLTRAVRWEKQTHLPRDQRQIIKDSILSDINRSFTGQTLYIEVLKNWNNLYMGRLLGEQVNAIASGSDLYRDFMENGVADWEQFLEFINEIGITPEGQSEQAAPFKKLGENGKMKDLYFAKDPRTPILTDASGSFNATIEELLAYDPYFGMTKELAYFTVFAGLTNRIYGDDNMLAGEYTPFTETMKRLHALDLQPVTYAVRKGIDRLETNDTDVIFDWYGKALYPDQYNQ